MTLWHFYTILCLKQSVRKMLAHENLAVREGFTIYIYIHMNRFVCVCRCKKFGFAEIGT
jgi:hypothetical protein